MVADDWLKAKMASIFTAIELLIVLVVLIVNTAKMIKGKRLRSKSLMMMLVTLNFATIGRMIYFGGFFFIFQNEWKDQTKDVLYVLKVLVPYYLLSTALVFHFFPSWIFNIIDICLY